MIRLLIICLKCMYWMLIGWWLEPIKYIQRIKIQKMEDEITKAKYNELKEKKEEI